MTAFNTWKELLNEFRELGLPPEQANSLETCINSTHFYYRSYLKDVVEIESSYRSHCITHALSDPKIKAFAGKCKDHIDEDCHHCELVHKIKDAFEQIAEQLKPNMDAKHPCKYNKIIYGIRNSYKRIFQYHGHIMRSAIQNLNWESLMTYDGKTALVTIDYAMKHEAEYYREPTTKHYAKSGNSWHHIVFVTCQTDAHGNIVKNIQSHIAIIDGNAVKQDTGHVVALIRTSLQLFTHGNPKVENIFIKSDNVCILKFSIILNNMFEKIIFFTK